MAEPPPPNLSPAEKNVFLFRSEQDGGVWGNKTSAEQEAVVCREMGAAGCQAGFRAAELVTHMGPKLCDFKAFPELDLAHPATALSSASRPVSSAAASGFHKEPQGELGRGSSDGTGTLSLPNTRGRCGKDSM